MKKIASLFKRDYEGDRQVINEIVKGSEWVTNGEGLATVKFDGTACMVQGGVLYKRYQHKAGKTPPEGFMLEEIISQKDRYGKLITKHFGWLKVTDTPSDKYHNMVSPEGLKDGTYELVGEKVNGNKENIKGHQLVRHGCLKLPSVPRDFVGIRMYLEFKNIEGIVWHHPDGRMVKIKKRDFGLKW